MTRPPSLIRSVCLSLLLLLCCLPSLQAQRTIHVPADQPTVQAAIDAAADGDTVLIAAGDYQESIDFKGKAITVTGTSNFADVRIVGNGQAATVSLVSGEGRNSILTSLTVEGGATTGSAEQAGIIIRGGSPTLRKLQIFGATCHGVHAVNGAPLIDSSRLVVTDASQTDTRCTVANGAAVFLEGAPNKGSAVIQNNVFNGNTTGVFASGGASVLIQKNVLSENGPGVDGGKGAGILIDKAQALIVGNLIYDNFAQTAGGGIAILNSGSASSPVQVVNNTVADNRSIGSGNIFAAPYAGADLDIEGTGAVTASNNIFWANTTGAAVTCNGASSPPPASTSFNNNSVFNALGPTVAGVAVGACTLQPGQNGNIGADPLFADVGFFQFRLTAHSPAIDAGNNDSLYATSQEGADILTDLDGNPRVVNGQMQSAPAIVDMGAYEFQNADAPTVFALTSSLNPSTIGQSVTFSAAVTLQSGPGAGSLTFQDSTTTLGTVPLIAGMAQLSTAALTAGTHQITALYNPNGSGAGSTTTIKQVVNGNPTSTSVSVSPSTGPAFSTVTLGSRVASRISGTPTGTVTFTAAGHVLATAPLQPDGTAQAVLQALGAGSYNITATYAGDSTFQPSTSSSASLVLSPVGITLGLSSTPSPAAVGQGINLRAVVPFTPPNTVPTGTVTFTTGAVTLATVSLNGTGAATLSTSTLAAGTHVITATYSGDPNYLPGSASVQEIVTLNATSTSLTAAPNPSFLGQAVTLTSSTTSGGTRVDGVVTFYDGQTALGMVSTTGGSATLSTSTLTPEQHTLTSVFQASTVYASSTSSPVILSVLPAGFTVGVSPKTITLHAGEGANTLVQLTSLGTFAGPLKLSFGQMPPHATGTLAAAFVMLGAGAQGSTSFSISTVDLTAATQAASHRTGIKAIVLAILLLPGLLWKRRRLPRTLLSLSLSLVCVSLVGCTDIGYPLATVPPGLYSISITATDSHNVSQTAVLQLNVTK